jgi:hypothetical protein
VHLGTEHLRVPLSKVAEAPPQGSAAVEPIRLADHLAGRFSPTDESPIQVVAGGDRATRGIDKGSKDSRVARATEVHEEGEVSACRVECPQAVIHKAVRVSIETEQGIRIINRACAQHKLE